MRNSSLADTGTPTSPVPASPVDNAFNTLGGQLGVLGLLSEKLNDRLGPVMSDGKSPLPSKQSIDDIPELTVEGSSPIAKRAASLSVEVGNLISSFDSILRRLEL